jgi:catechol-2,3-dioxygenase
MFKETGIQLSFSVNDIENAKEFYTKTLGLEVSEMNGLLNLHRGRNRYIDISKTQSYSCTLRY